MSQTAPKQRDYDVVICGGGLAGLTLARQLSLQQPELAVAVIDKLARPLPEAAFKVGESTVVAGAAYLGKVLGLEDYLRQRQTSKLGLRYFFKDDSANGSFAARPELGRARYLPGVIEWQLDRGRFENDLREMVSEAGVELLEGVSVEAILLDERGPHTVRCRAADDGSFELRGAWVVDAMSRRRLLRKGLGLSRARGLKYSACWFRVGARLDVDDFVSTDDAAWHARVESDHPFDPSYGRYNSTNHLIGRGYWVWLIPLPNGNTSVGIVCLEDDHPWRGYNTYPRALEWLQRHEPEIASRLAPLEPLDFRVMRNYTFFSERVISHERWALAGEAGWFADPFYSPGTDAIAYMNCIICEAIARDREGSLTEDVCQHLDEDHRSWGENVTQSIQVGYSLFGDPVIGALKIVADLSFGFGLNTPLFSSAFFRPGFSKTMRQWATPELVQKVQQVQALAVHIFQLLRDWRDVGRTRVSFQWLDYFGLPYLRELAESSLQPRESPASQLARACELLPELALAIQYLAAVDVAPDKAKLLEQASALNPWAIHLDTSLWQPNGLFSAGPGSMPFEQVERGVLAQLRQYLHVPD